MLRIGSFEYRRVDSICVVVDNRCLGRWAKLLTSIASVCFNRLIVSRVNGSLKSTWMIVTYRKGRSLEFYKLR